MKVALYNLTTTTKAGGVESFVWELARHLARNYPDLQVDIIGGHSPVNFQPLNPGPHVRIFTRPFLRRETLRRLPILNRLYGPTKLIERLTLGLTALPMLYRQHYDVIYIQKPYDLPLAQLLRLLTGAGILFGCHGKDFFPLDRLFTKNLAGTVSCSHYNAQTIQAHYGLLPHVIYNGIDTEIFQPRPASPALLARYAPHGETLFMFAGRLVRWKGAQYLIEALARMVAQGLAAKVLIAGDGPYRAELEKLAYSLGIGDKVIFLGNLPNRELPDYYASCRAIVGTSFANETFGIALCEAAACERPIIASAFGGFKEVVRDGQTGLLYEPQNPIDLAAKLTILMQNPELADQMGRAGRAFVLKHFTWNAVAARVYQELITGHAPGVMTTPLKDS